MTDIPFQFILNILILATIVGLVVYFMLYTPVYKHVDEGFYGGVTRGSGHPDCLRTLPEGSEILEALMGRIRLEEGNADYSELQLILSKLSCLKKDLLSPSGIVLATRHFDFVTAHDREHLGQVCADCLAQTIPKRDLDIIFGTWRDRGNVLLRKLCTEASLKENEVVKLENLFTKAWSDVYDVAKSRCLKVNYTHFENDPASVGAYTPPGLEELRRYDGYYSGWSGAV